MCMDDARIQRILRQHLQTDRLLGIASVPLGAAGSASVANSPQLFAATEAEPSREQVAEVAAQIDAAVTITPAAELFREATAPAAIGGTPVPAEFTRIDRTTKIELLNTMDEFEVRACTKCGLCKGRRRTVFGEGDPDAPILFIGEGPGQTEDEQGRPFVGPAGQLLDKMILAMGLKRESVFIANVVKCRPPNNRAPLPDEIDACWPYLKRQIEAIQPRVIVTLGGPATKLILHTERGITAIRGIWSQFHGLVPTGPVIPVMPTFHPAYLLRSYTEDNRRKVWSDLKKVMEMLKLSAGKK